MHYAAQLKRDPELLDVPGFGESNTHTLRQASGLKPIPIGKRRHCIADQQKEVAMPRLKLDPFFEDGWSGMCWSVALYRWNSGDIIPSSGYCSVLQKQ